MAKRVGRSDIKSYKRKWESAKKSMARYKKKANAAVGTVVHSMEVGGTAFFFGLLQGRKGSIELFGGPVELWAAGAAHLAGFLEVGGRETARHLHGLGDGALGAYMTTLGRDVGFRMAQKAGAKPKVKGEDLPGGDWPGLPQGGTELTPDDRAMMEVIDAIP